MFRPIKTAPELDQAILSTYLYDALIAVVFVLIIVLVANLINFQRGKIDHSGKTRRVWLFVLMGLAFVSALVFDYFAWYDYIKVDAFANKYTTHMIVAPIVSMIEYFGIAFLIVKLSPRGSKLNSIFPSNER